MIRTYDNLIDMVRSKPDKKRVVVAAAHDLHTLEGIHTAYSQGIILPILVGDKEKIAEIISENNFQFHRVEIIDEKDHREAARKAVDLIRSGQGDILMKGRLQTSELMGEVVDKARGLKTGGVISHVGLFQIPSYHKLMVLTDGGMIIAPNVEQKKQIVENAVNILNQMGYSRPKVAILCATEVENSKMSASVDAAILKRWNENGELMDCIVEGPISFDLMYDKKAAEVKGYESQVTGEADICLFPDMTAGNLVAKSLMCAAGAKMAGLIVGASVPIVLVSRGATSEEKYLSLVFAAAVAK